MATSLLKSLARPCQTIAHCRRPIRISAQKRWIAVHAYTHHATALSTIQSKIDPSSEEFRENASAMDHLVSSLKEQHKRIVAGGPAKARDKHVARGKMLPREYVAAERSF